MTTLIQYLYTEIFQPILTYISNIANKQIIDGTLISSPITFGELVQYILPVITAVIIIILFVKAVIKICGGLFVWN